MRLSHWTILAATTSLIASGCVSTGSNSTKVRQYSWSGLDSQLPNGSNSTPSHKMSKYEYPFDSNGRYIASWAAEGERRLGRSSNRSRGSSRKRTGISSSGKSNTKYHRIVSGDTLYGLARKYGTSVSAIKRANGMSSDVIIKGKTIKIP
ncbi:MAG: LysM peptidoglycan-binding domain-containing protein [Verrucomicrobiota bacterium]|nr:LysM peptidoglycan-binding domain-containing protein [Verrucomicrobiota bacterium]